MLLNFSQLFLVGISTYVKFHSYWFTEKIEMKFNDIFCTIFFLHLSTGGENDCYEIKTIPVY
jgi:hypothetical protein